MQSYDAQATGAPLLSQHRMTHPIRPILKGILDCIYGAPDLTLHLAVLLLMQVAPGQAYARFGVICRILGGLPAERVDHEHLLPSFAWTAASLFGAEGSHRQRSRCCFLPFPLLLSVSVEYQ